MFVFQRSTGLLRTAGLVFVVLMVAMMVFPPIVAHAQEGEAIDYFSSGADGSWNSWGEIAPSVYPSEYPFSIQSGDSNGAFRYAPYSEGMIYQDSENASPFQPWYHHIVFPRSDAFGANADVQASPADTLDQHVFEYQQIPPRVEAIVPQHQWSDQQLDSPQVRPAPAFENVDFSQSKDLSNTDTRFATSPEVGTPSNTDSKDCDNNPQDCLEEAASKTRSPTQRAADVGEQLIKNGDYEGIKSWCRSNGCTATDVNNFVRLARQNAFNRACDNLDFDTMRRLNREIGNSDDYSDKIMVQCFTRAPDKSQQPRWFTPPAGSSPDPTPLQPSIWDSIASLGRNIGTFFADIF